MSASLEAHHARASRLLASVMDVVDERPDGRVAPAWSVNRGWAPFLEGLSDEVVLALERDGLGAWKDRLPGAPPQLVELAREVAEVVLVPRVAAGPRAPTARRASPRKLAQVESLARLARPLADTSQRVVDVGAGHGHLTRRLADALELPTLGIERDRARVEVATALPGRATFVVADASRGASFEPMDLVVGLHACGALGDAVIEAVARAGAATVLVGCCLQKREGERAPLVEGGPTLRREVLGLGNARLGDVGVEADLEERNAARARRAVLRVLFEASGVAVSLGEEMRGLNRRRAHGDVASLARAAFAARGLPSPSAASIAHAEERAAEQHHRARRHAVARNLFARAIEVWVALDRALHLARRGRDARVVEAWDDEVSPRNLAVVAGRA